VASSISAFFFQAALTLWTFTSDMNPPQSIFGATPPPAGGRLRISRALLPFRDSPQH
jgi:hypothetical protein